MNYIGFIVLHFGATDGGEYCYEHYFASGSRKNFYLASELDKDITLHGNNAQKLLFVVQFMMIVTVLSSILAGFGGLLKLWKQETVGALALVPGIMAFIAATMRFPEKATRHARFRDGLMALRQRLLFQLPENPSAENVAGISKDLTILRARMQKEREALAFNWNQFKGHEQEGHDSKQQPPHP